MSTLTDPVGDALRRYPNMPGYSDTDQMIVNHCDLAAARDALAAAQAQIGVLQEQLATATSRADRYGALLRGICEMDAAMDVYRAYDQLVYTRRQVRLALAQPEQAIP